jgi:hypothetical protein
LRFIGEEKRKSFGSLWSLKMTAVVSIEARARARARAKARAKATAGPSTAFPLVTALRMTASFICGA